MEKPKRNVWCPKYSDCLNEAIKIEKTFDCRGCKFEKNQDGKEGTFDNFSYCLLFVAMFFPEIYKAYRKYQRNQDGEARAELEALIEEIREDRGTY